MTVSRKFGYDCVYVFHVIAPATQIWQKLIFQTNIFNIFPASVPQNTVVKVLQSNCISQSKKYVPVRSLWLNRVFTDLANSHEKHCLTIDCSYKNENGPGRYRSVADNPDEQVCYFHEPNDDECYNVFIRKRIKAENFSERILRMKESKRRQKKRTLTLRKHKKMAQAMIDCQKFSQFQSQSRLEQEQEKYMETIEHPYRRDRKSARPKFISRQ